MSDGSTLKVYCDMHNGTWRIHTPCTWVWHMTNPSTSSGGWTRVVNIQGSTKQNTYAITGALNAGKFDKKSSYKLTDKQINEIAADAGTKDFLLICSDEVEFGKFRSVCS